MVKGIIYGLVGPEGIRYIGQTRRELRARYAQHAKHAKQGKPWRVSRWWRTLGQPPRAIILEVCDPAELNDKEIGWIAFARGLGIDLCNHTAGGQNPVPDAETRARMSASAKRRLASPEARAQLREWGRQRKGTFSAETRAKMSAGMRAAKGTPQARALAAEQSRGRTHTPEARARIGAANRVHMTGRTMPAETREKIADANRGKKRSPETRERMRQAWVLRRAGSAQ